MSDRAYGYFGGGDPRSFLPDLEVCIPDEVRAWLAAVGKADTTGAIELATSSVWVPTEQGAKHYHRYSFGMGTYRLDGMPFAPVTVSARVAEAVTFLRGEKGSHR